MTRKIGHDAPMIGLGFALDRWAGIEAAARRRRVTISRDL